jgi:transposase
MGTVMLSFSGSLKVLVALEPCDMRKGFNGLHALVTERLGEDLKQGALFVFSNRRHTRIKIICWDGTGIWVLTKRLVSHCPLYRICKAALSVFNPVRRNNTAMPANHNAKPFYRPAMNLNIA